MTAEALDGAVYELVELADRQARGWEGVSEDWPVEMREAAADAVIRHEVAAGFLDGDRWDPRELRWWR